MMIVNRIIKNSLLKKYRSLKPVLEDKRQQAALVFNVSSPLNPGFALAIHTAQQGLKTYLTTTDKAALPEFQKALDEYPQLDTSLHCIACAEQDQIRQLFAQIDEDGYAIDLVVHTSSSQSQSAFLDIDRALLEREWEEHYLSAFYLAQASINAMQDKARGTIIFVGSACALQGQAQLASFSSATSGLRMMAQSMAREFGPQGIHIAHLVLSNEARLSPETSISDTCWHVYQQHKTAWSHEITIGS